MLACSVRGVLITDIQNTQQIKICIGNIYLYLYII